VGMIMASVEVLKGYGGLRDRKRQASVAESCHLSLTMKLKREVSTILIADMKRRRFSDVSTQRSGGWVIRVSTWPKPPIVRVGNSDYVWQQNPRNPHSETIVTE
jgi:hypothetical protein